MNKLQKIEEILEKHYHADFDEPYCDHEAAAQEIATLFPSEGEKKDK